MRVGPWLDTSWPVFTPQPIYRGHPLNHGRVSWWLTLPGLEGGKSWHDLLGLIPGALTNGPSWGGTTRPGGWGQLNFDGSNDVVYAAGLTTSAPAALILPNTVSIAAWVRTAATPANFATIAGLEYSSPRGNPFASYKLHSNFNSSQPAFVLGIGGTQTALNAGAGFGGLVTGRWYRLVGTYDGATQRLYIDGVQVASQSASGSLAHTSTGPFMIGANAVAAEATNGAIDDVTVWGRALSAAEVRADYDLSRAGYPGVLNRWRPSVTTIAVSGGGTDGTATPAAVTATGTLPAASLSGGANTAPAALTGAGTLPAASLSGGATASPSVLTAAGTLPAPTLSGDASTAPAVLTAAGTLPAPTISGGGGSSPAALTAAGTIPAPALSGGGTVTVTALAPSGVIPAPTVTGDPTTAPAVVSLAGPTVQSYWPVFTPAPVNRQHNLNTGRVLWHLSLPGLDGGRTFVDLVGLGTRPATLTAMGNANNGWRGSTRPGALSAHVLGDGTAGYVSSPLAWSDLPASSYTLALWVRHDAVGSTQTYLSIGSHALISTAATSWRWQYDGGGFPTVTGTVGSRSNGEWHSYAVSVAGTGASQAKIYYDGKLLQTGTMSQALTSGALAALCQGGTFRFTQGAFDDLGVWNRPLSDAEIFDWHDQSRRGNPQTLNRWRPGLTVFAAGGVDANATPAAVSGTGVLPAPTLSAGAGASPAVLVGTGTLPAPGLSGGGNVAPGVLIGSAVTAAPTLAGGATFAASVLTAAGVLPAATASASDPGTALPAAVAAVGTLPAPSLVISSAASPAAVFGTVTVAAPEVTGDPLEGLARDDAILVAARDLLLAEPRHFRQVECGLGPNDYVFPADEGIYAVLYFDNVAEVDDAMSGDTPDELHTTTYMIQITVRDDNPLRRLARMERAKAVARNRLDGVSIGGITFPALTKLRLDRPVTTVNPPDSTYRMRGEWTYLVDGPDGHDEADFESQW